jgi:vitamin B12 transporter
VAKAESRGVELSSLIYPVSDLSFGINYTYTEAKDEGDDENLLQRPEHKVKGNIGYRLFKRASLNAEGFIVGEKYDYPRVALDGYKVLNLAASYDLSSMFRVFFRLENIFNEEYEEVDGYGTAGRSLYAGLKLSI